MIYLHLSAVRRGVDKLIITNVNSHMSTIPTPFKKDQIPFLQLVLFHLLSYLKLFPGSSGKLNIKNLIDLFHKRRTINPL